MRSFIRGVVAISLMTLPSISLPCTMVMVDDGDRALVGNNEDTSRLDTRMWVVPPGNGEYGRICYGLSDGFTQGGMNDQGLFIDGNHVHAKGWKRDPAKPDFEGRNEIDQVLARCATVDEAAAFFRSHNTPSLANAKFPIADARGGAIIVEWGDGALQIHQRSGSHQISTNFVESDQPNGRAPCERYRIADAMLAGGFEPSVDAVRGVLSATHQELRYPTVYSNIYDLKAKTVHLYLHHDFEHAVVLDLAKELAKGERTVDISSLFQEAPYSLHEFRRSRPRPGSEVLLEVIDQDGIDAAVARYHDLRRDFKKVHRVDVGEAEINQLGYLLLKSGRHDEAVRVLRLNVSEHPESANTYDSLGEALAARGDVEAAVASYRRSLELDPENHNAEQRLRELQGRPQERRSGASSTSRSMSKP